MGVYIVAQLKFKNRVAYSRYQSRFMDVFRQFDGQLLVADDVPGVLEGEWRRDKIVIMSFPDETAATRFRMSSEYQSIAVDRREGAEAIVLLAHGLDNSP